MLPVASAADAEKITQLHTIQRHTITAKIFLIAFMFFAPFVFHQMIFVVQNAYLQNDYAVGYYNPKTPA